MSPEPKCFLAGTKIDMWPLDPGLRPGADGLYDEREVLAGVWKKPIEQITAADTVVSFDKAGNLQPGRVTRTFANRSKIVLDFFGTGVTPGHVYSRPDSKKPHKFEPLIDSLRDDGLVQRENGTLIRAATGREAGSDDDREFWAFTLYDADAIRKLIADQDAWANIPAMPQRRFRPAFSKHLYKMRNMFGRLFNKLKHFQAMATRYDKDPENFLAGVKLASIRIWLRFNESVS